MATGKISKTYVRIWEAVRRIPRGRVATYGQIARVSGFAGKARLVGYALHNIPPNLPIPWHRVINARGMISLPKRNPHHRLQRELLRKEGVIFRGEKVDLKRKRWTS